MSDLWGAQLEALGAYIRGQRQLANLTLREMAELTHVSNPYLSQIERGMHQPSVRVLKAIAEALDISAESLLVQAGLLSDVDAEDEAFNEQTVEASIRSDRMLSNEQKQALVAVYRSMINMTSNSTPG